MANGQGARGKRKNEEEEELMGFWRHDAGWWAREIPFLGQLPRIFRLVGFGH